MPLKLSYCLALICLAGVAAADKADYFGIYLNGVKLGHGEKTSQSVMFRNHRAKKLVEKYLVPSVIQTSEVTYVSEDGRPIWTSQDFVQEGVSRHLEAEFAMDFVVTKLVEGGLTVSHRVSIPKGVRLLADFSDAIDPANAKVGDSARYVEFDAEKLVFIDQKVIVHGPTSLTLHGIKKAATWLTLRSDDQDMETYMSPNGDILRQSVGNGMELFLESPTDALLGIAKDPMSAFKKALALPPVVGLTSPDSLVSLTLALAGTDLKALPSDDHQTATKTPQGWTLAVHPTQLAQEPPATISQAAKLRPSFIKPEKLIPSDQPNFIELAKKIIGTKTDVLGAARSIQMYTASLINYDEATSNGPQRDANQILASRKGVCRDFTILALTLMRAAGIPARGVYGLVTFDADNGVFDYHTWLSVFDGSKWVDLDPSGVDSQVSAAYIELGLGTIYADAGSVLMAMPHMTIKLISSK